MRYIKDTPRLREIGRILILFLIFVPLLASAAIYQWRDADGSMVYSQTPPPDGRAASKVKAPPPPAESPEQAQQKLQTLQQRLDDLRKKRETTAEDNRKQEAASNARQQNCRTARNSLQQLQDRPHPLTNDGQGGMRHMTTEERAQRLEQLRQDVKKYCD
jgi:alkanesulfonate monooxygenase SsuD/methylene tetrahydromethanopterin reductase-like flavin-dependent oxidoreductase (luciferase family)